MGWATICERDSTSSSEVRVFVCQQAQRRELLAIVTKGNLQH